MVRGMVFLAFLCVGAAAVAQTPAAEITYVSCGACHGDGAGRNAIPEIRGLPEETLLASLNGFAKDAGTSTIMHRFIVALTPEEIEDLARHVSRLEGVSR